MAIERTPALRKHRPFTWHRRADPFTRIRDEMSEVFSHYARPATDGDGEIEVFDVSLDTAETDEAYEITLDVPGVDRKDIDISFDNGRLTISGERQREEDKKGKSFHRTERSFGAFQTSFTLPSEVDESKIDAKLKDGVLRLTVPKSETAKKAARKIAIKGT